MYYVVATATDESKMSVSSDVIDWPEAMEQCGDDEDFLRELLSDLRGEIAVQVEKIEDVLKVRGSSSQPHSRTVLLPSSFSIILRMAQSF